MPASSGPSDLFPRVVDFDEEWNRLRIATLTLLAGPGHLSRADWHDRHSDVFSLCIAVPNPFGQRLYKEVKRFLEEHVQSLSKRLQSVSEENVLAEYYGLWETYSAGITYTNQLYWYLNAHVVPRHKYCENRIDFSQYGIEHNGKMVEIGQLTLKVWEQEMVVHRRHLLIGLLLKEIDKDRDGFVVNHNVIQQVVQSLVELRKFRFHSRLQPYQEMFEMPFFKATKEYYAHESQKLRDLGDCSVFMTKIMRRINDEEIRARRYLHESSFLRVLIECKLCLLSDENIDFMNGHCRSFTQKERWNDLSTMYQLLSLLDDSKLDLMISELKSHLTTVGLGRLQSIDSSEDRENMAAKYVDVLLEFYYSYKEKITQTFQSKLKASFVSAFEKACSAVINVKPSATSVCKLPELLAGYCDELLRKHTKGLSESEIDDRLNQITLLFRYVEDKDLFERFYARKMAKRLIFQYSVSMEMEESMINRLRQVCGHEYISKLQRMFNDVTISADLTSKFAASSRHLGLAFSLTILQAGVWPIPHLKSRVFLVPQEFEKSIQLFEQFYNEQFSGRKLNWLNNLSSVDVRLGYCKRPYMATVDMHTVTLLLAYNTTDQMTLHELKDVTQLPDDDLLRLLQTLVEAKILLSQLPLTAESIYVLNLQYKNKRTKFKIIATATASDTQQDVDQTQLAVENDRRFYIEAAIVRIMKARKELSHSSLVEEVIGQSKARFTAKISIVKKCIESLLEREYIARSAQNTSNYIYVA